MYIKRYDGPSGRGVHESLIGSTRGFDTTGASGFYEGPSDRGLVQGPPTHG